MGGAGSPWNRFHKAIACIWNRFQGAGAGFAQRAGLCWAVARREPYRAAQFRPAEAAALGRRGWSPLPIPPNGHPATRSRLVGHPAGPVWVCPPKAHNISSWAIQRACLGLLAASHAIGLPSSGALEWRDGLEALSWRAAATDSSCLWDALLHGERGASVQLLDGFENDAG